MDGEQAPAATDLVELVDVESELDDESEFDDSKDDYSGLGQGDDETAAARDESLPERGCQHYRRGCKLVAPCCGEAFWCRFCHDAAKEEGEQAAGAVPHKLDRHAVTQVECGSCGLRQPVAQVCTNESCGISFGNYFCRIGNFLFLSPLTGLSFPSLGSRSLIVRVCMCVCVCACVCACKCVYVSLWVCVCYYVYSLVYVCVYLYICISVFVLATMCAHVHAVMCSAHILLTSACTQGILSKVVQVQEFFFKIFT